MPDLPLRDLEELGRDLDLFPESPAPEEDLVTAGLHPPLPIAPREDGLLSEDRVLFEDGGLLVWGHRLIPTARRLGCPTLPVVRLPRSSPAALLKIALRLENRSGRFTWAERARCLAWLEGPVGPTGPPGPRPWETDAELVGLLEGGTPGAGGPRRFWERVHRYSLLRPAVSALVERGLLDLRTALRVETDGALPEAVFELLGPEGPSLSHSERRVLLEELLEVHLRTGEDPVELFRRVLSGPAPARRAHRLRFPELTALEDRFEAFRREALGGTGLRLEAPPGFEGDSWRLSFGFRDRAELARRVQALRRLEERVDELADLLA